MKKMADDKKTVKKKKKTGFRLFGKITASGRETKPKKKRKKGFFYRVKKYKNRLAKRSFVTAEQVELVYSTVFREECHGMYIFLTELFENLWDFISKLGWDSYDIFRFWGWLLRKIADILSTVFLWIGDRFWDLFFWIDRKKKKLFTSFCILASVFAITLIAINSMTAYEYSYYGKTLGTARRKEDVYKIIEVLGDKLSDAKNAKINIDVERDIVFTRVIGLNIDVDTDDEILNTLTYMKDIKATGYAIVVDGESLCVMQNEEAAKKLLSDYKNTFAGVKSGVEYSVVNYKEAVNIEEEQVLLGDIWNPDDALNYLLTGSVEELPEGESGTPLITLYSVETATYEENIDYGIDYIENSGMYTDETELISDGVYGTNLIVATVERINGEEISRVIESSTLTSNPTNAVYYQGTKPIPASKGTGTYIFPLGTSTPYTVTSWFGVHRSAAGLRSEHAGIDLACATGSYVYAADGGTIYYAGYGEGLGYCIFIDHGGLMRTVYGHMSELWVSKGDTVAQGTILGLSGSSGYSTGPHLHFEIRYKDNPVDPLNYITLR